MKVVVKQSQGARGEEVQMKNYMGTAEEERVIKNLSQEDNIILQIKAIERRLKWERIGIGSTRVTRPKL